MFSYNVIKEPAIKVLEIFLKHTHTHREINLLLQKLKSGRCTELFLCPGKHSTLCGNAAPPQVESIEPVEMCNLLHLWEHTDSKTSLGACHVSYKPQTKMWRKALPLCKGNRFSYLRAKEGIYMTPLSSNKNTNMPHTCSLCRIKPFCLGLSRFPTGTNGALKFISVDVNGANVISSAVYTSANSQ